MRCMQQGQTPKGLTYDFKTNPLPNVMRTTDPDTNNWPQRVHNVNNNAIALKQHNVQSFNVQAQDDNISDIYIL